MTRGHVLGFASLTLLVFGCGVGSVAPLVSDRTTHYDPRLLGTWRDSSGPASAVVTLLGADHYSLAYTDEDGKLDRFKAVLGRVGGIEILDVEPEEPELNASDLYKAFLLPLHGALFIDSIGSKLRFRLLESDSLARYLERRPHDIDHLLRDDFVVLTASTDELQRFLPDFVRRPGALGEPNVWIRQSP